METIGELWTRLDDACAVEQARIAPFELDDPMICSPQTLRSGLTKTPCEGSCGTRTTEMHYIHVERDRLRRSINPKHKTRSKGVKNA